MVGRRVLELDDLRVGDEKTVTIGTTIESGDNAGDPKSPGSGSTFLCFDPDRETTATADSGSTTTLVDSDRSEADDFWNGMTLVVTDASDGQEYETEVTDFDQATGAFTFYAIPAAVTAGDRYRLEGYPLLTETAATISDNEASVQLTPSNVTGTPGRRVLVYHADFGTDAQEVVCRFRVLASNEG